MHWITSMQGKKVVPCRFDWHQTGSQVIISIYAKNAVPELCYVDANSTTVRDIIVCLIVSFSISTAVLLCFGELNVYSSSLPQLNIHVIFDGEKEFEQKISLWGVSTETLWQVVLPLLHTFCKSFKIPQYKYYNSLLIILYQTVRNMSKWSWDLNGTNSSLI